jgi:type IV secretory pathway TrbD component
MRSDGFELVLHRSLTEPILIGGAPRAAAILIGKPLRHQGLLQHHGQMGRS